MGSEILRKKPKFQAPDGGWGYLICVASAINISTVLVFANTFDMIFHDFSKNIKIESPDSLLLLGFNNVFYACGGFFTHSMLKMMSHRKLALLSAIVYDFGVIGTIFAESYATFFICQGFIMGVAGGTMFNLSFSILNEYFEKKKLFAFSLVFAVLAALKMIAPIFVDWSLRYYGYRGTVMLIAGISLQNILAVALMQPVKWHRTITPGLSKENGSLLGRKQKKSIVIKVINTAHDETTKNIGNNFGEDYPRNHDKVWNFIENFVDVNFFKKFIRCGACSGTSLALSADMAFTSILSQALSSFGCGQDEVTTALKLYGGADLVMRLLMVVLSPWILRLGSQETYLIGITLDVLTKLALIMSERPIIRHILVFFMGISRCFISVLVPLVVADAAPPGMFTQALGITMLMLGLITIVLGAMIEATRNLTTSYFTALFLLTSFLAISLLFWSIEIYYKKNKYRREARQMNLRSKITNNGR